jgi:hypothetical protein
MRWVLLLVLLVGCGLNSSPELVAEIGMPEVTAAWWEGESVVVVANVEPDQASELCGQIYTKLDTPLGGVTVQYGAFPWDSDGVACIA